MSTSILPGNVLVSPVPVLASVGIRQTQYKNLVTASFVQSVKLRVSFWNSQFDSFWTNANGLTPQQCADALGTAAGDFFAKAAAEAAYLNGIVAGAITKGPPKSVTANADGTVTIGA